MGMITEYLEEIEFHQYESIKLSEVKEWILKQEKSGANLIEFTADETYVYLESILTRPETQEEINIKIKNQLDAKRLVDKVEFEKAKETYLRLKDKFE